MNIYCRYTHNNDWFNAQRVAKAYDPDSVTEILLLQAMSAFDDKRFAEFEALLIRAEQPELIVKKYRDASMNIIFKVHII